MRLVLQMIEKLRTDFSPLHGKKLLHLGQRGVIRIIYTITISKQEAHRKRKEYFSFKSRAPPSIKNRETLEMQKCYS